MKRAVLSLVLAGAVCAPVPGVGQDAPAYPDFTFRRLKAPPAGKVGHITVQIDPVAQARRLAQLPRPSQTQSRATPEGATQAAPADSAQAPARPGAFSWYWDVLSPSLDDSGPGRLEVALRALKPPAGKRAVPTPRLEALQGIADQYGKDIMLATIGKKVSPALVLAVMSVESGGDATALSSAGAQGLMQLIPATATRFSVPKEATAADNIRGGVAYLDWLMNEFNNDPVMVLAAYNAGENAVKDNGGVPPFAQTRDYVPRVLAAWKVARGLCVTAPELVSDGCVFAVREAKKDE